MIRVCTLAIAFLPLLRFAALGQPSSAPMVHLSFYAPAQADPPVHIVGFEHGRSEIRFVLSNTSDKPVVAVFITDVDFAPRGCTLRPSKEKPVMSFNPMGYAVSIAPHRKGVVAKEGLFSLGDTPGPAYPHWPRVLVYHAKEASASYIQVQFGITAVFFKDGTTWPAEMASLSKYLDPRFVDIPPVHAVPPPTELPPAERDSMRALYRSEPFDDSLVDSEEGRCTDVAAVARALQAVKEVVFERQSPDVSNREDKEHAIPQLRFSCSLEGPKAVCRLPLEMQSAQ
jgi:hypothetical protein